MKMVNDEISELLELDSVQPELRKYIETFSAKPEVFTKHPVCVLSHKFLAIRSKFLVELLKEAETFGLNRNYYIFTYSDQAELYKKFEDIDNINVIYIDHNLSEYSTLTGKRQFILEWCTKNKHEHAFFIEDDVSRFHLPLIKETGEKYSNDKRYISNAFLFSFWEFVIEKNSLMYSGLMSNMEFTFRDLRIKSFLKHHFSVIQASHASIKMFNELGFRFDENSGWDDYDMILQNEVYGNGTHGLCIGYTTPSLKSGTSTISTTAEALEQRCIVNTNKLVDKWGKFLVKIDQRKGLYNAKIYWTNMTKARRLNVPLINMVKRTKLDELGAKLDGFV